MKKSKNSIVRNLKIINVATFLIFVFSVLIAPLFSGTYFIHKINEEFYNLITSGDISKKDIIEEGFNVGLNIEVEGSDTIEFYLSDQLCTPDEFINKGVSTEIIFKEDCPSMTVSMSTLILSRFLRQLVIYSFAALLVVQIGIYFYYRYNRRMIEDTVISVNEEVKKIRDFGLGQLDMSDNKNNFEEFSEILEMVDISSRLLKTHMKDKDLLIQTLNHELKTPINKINSIIQAYEIKMQGYTDDKVVLRKIEAELGNMTSIIEYSLQIFTTQNDNLTKVDVEKIFRVAIDERSETIQLNRLNFKIKATANEKLLVEPEKFNLVISNLIENSVKYGLNNSTVNIRISNKKISIANKVDTSIVSGTQKGLKLATQILSTMDMQLKYGLKENVFVVEIIL